MTVPFQREGPKFENYRKTDERSRNFTFIGTKIRPYKNQESEKIIDPVALG